MDHIFLFNAQSWELELFRNVEDMAADCADMYPDTIYFFANILLEEVEETHYDERTLDLVRASISRATSFILNRNALNIIVNELQNDGILFRERVDSSERV